MTSAYLPAVARVWQVRADAMTGSSDSVTDFSLELAERLCGEIIDRAFFLSTWPYFRVYRLNTYLPIQSIISETDESTTSGLIERWIETRKVEVKYVQVAVSLKLISRRYA